MAWPLQAVRHQSDSDGILSKCKLRLYDVPSLHSFLVPFSCSAWSVCKRFTQFDLAFSYQHQPDSNLVILTQLLKKRFEDMMRLII